MDRTGKTDWQPGYGTANTTCSFYAYEDAQTAAHSINSRNRVLPAEWRRERENTNHGGHTGNRPDQPGPSEVAGVSSDEMHQEPDSVLQ